MVEPELTGNARTRHKLLSYLDERERIAGAPADSSEIARTLGWSEGFTADIVRVGERLGLLAMTEPTTGVSITPHGRKALSRDQAAMG